uniref:Uncharacterized protein n=1 Tax=Arundo donax TaxID=35708 RepID=A0A0A9HBD1_ARUDO
MPKLVDQGYNMGHETHELKNLYIIHINHLWPVGQ